MPPHRRVGSKWTHPSVLELVQSAGLPGSPDEVIRALVRQRVAEFESLGWEGPPYDMELLASLSNYRPKLVDWLREDQDACVTADEMLINTHKPMVRQRFSIGHEIGHTLFPDFRRNVEADGPRWRRQRDEHSQVEKLCQIAASEFLMPFRAFSMAMEERARNLISLLDLANLFNASPEATAHRFVDLSRSKVIAVFVSMKWKPSEVAALQQPFLGLAGFDAPPMKMRISYAVPSSMCGSVFLPPDKSIPNTSVAYNAWVNAQNEETGFNVANEDWSSVGRLGRCFVEAVALPLGCDTPQSVLCLVHPHN